MSSPNFNPIELHVLSEEREHTSVRHGGLKPTNGESFACRPHLEDFDIVNMYMIDLLVIGNKRKLMRSDAD